MLRVHHFDVWRVPDIVGVVGVILDDNFLAVDHLHPAAVHSFSRASQIAPDDPALRSIVYPVAT